MCFCSANPIVFSSAVNKNTYIYINIVNAYSVIWRYKKSKQTVISIMSCSTKWYIYFSVYSKIAKYIILARLKTRFLLLKTYLR